MARTKKKGTSPGHEEKAQKAGREPRRKAYIIEAQVVFSVYAESAEEAEAQFRAEYGHDIVGEVEVEEV